MNISFWGCSLLYKVNISSKCTSIGWCVFRNCSALGDIGDISNVNKYSTGCFINCLSLTNFTISSFCKTIQGDVWNGCKNIKWFKVFPTVPPSVTGGNNFAGISKLAIYVPDDSVDSYKSASGWSNSSTYIYPISKFATDFPNG